MYIIISYDYRNSNDVSIHNITTNLDKSISNYKIIIDWNRDYNKADNHFKLIELIQVEEDFFNKDGFKLYWYKNEDFTQAKILMTNNTDDS